jgi:long-chain fatty acid transport protein
MAFAGNRFDVGLDLFSPWREASRTGGAAFGLDGSAKSDSNYFGVPEGAFNYMVRPNLALGVTVYGNGGMNTDYPTGQSSPVLAGVPAHQLQPAVRHTALGVDSRSSSLR